MVRQEEPLKLLIEELAPLFQFYMLARQALVQGLSNGFMDKIISAALTLTAGSSIDSRRLGVGLTNPSYNLHVVGTGTITSDLTVAW